MASPRALRHVLLGLTAADDAVSTRACGIIVPTRSAAEYLRRAIEAARLAGAGAVVLPHLLTRADWLHWLVQHLPAAPTLLSPTERHVILGASARAAAAGGSPPPFGLRPAMVGEMLEFYDTVRRQLKTVDDLDRLASARFERDADEDRGAARMLTQARFLVATFREYERRLAELGRADEHILRACLLDESDTPLRRVIVTVGDRAADRFGLWAADFDLLARMNGLLALDVVATDSALDAGLLQRLREHLPGIEDAPQGETAEPGPRTTLVAPPADTNRLYFRQRDREDEIAWVARRIKQAHRTGREPSLARTAVVFKRPLPYVYLAGQVFPSAGIPHETSEALPLASEPFAAAVDLVIECVSTSFSRTAIVALLNSAHFRFESRGRHVGSQAVSILDRELSEARYLADPSDLSRLAGAWEAAAAGRPAGEQGRAELLASAAAAAALLPSELAGLLEDAPPSTHLSTLQTFLDAHQRLPAFDERLRQRHLRARAAVMGALASLRDAHRRFDDHPCPAAETAASLHRWIERQTFTPHLGGGGVQVIDAHAARFGDFDTVYLVGLTQREWPGSEARNIFFPGSMLKDLAWPDDADTRAAERAAFSDLLRLPSSRVLVSTFTLEDDAIAEPSPFLEDLAESGLPVAYETEAAQTRVFAQEALTGDPIRAEAVRGDAAGWLTLRLSRTSAGDARYHGQATPSTLPSYKVSALDRYIDCPFVFFAEQILRLKEEPQDEEGLSPRTVGRIVHEVFDAFFAAWQSAGHTAIVQDNLDEAGRLFAAVVEARLSAMPESDAAIERARLLGSPAAPGFGDVVLTLEAERPAPVIERLLEFTLNGATDLRSADGVVRRVSLRATADRIDLLADGTFRLFDYKLSKPPDRKHAVQLPAYAAAARARLDGYRGRSWRASAAAYVAFAASPAHQPVTRDSAKLDAVLAAGEGRLVSAVDRIERGEFPPQPLTFYRCVHCPYAGVCRKDYVGDE